MISTKMKEDAAKINAEIKKFSTKIPLAFLNYSYHNEDAKVVLHRRNDELNGMKDVKKFINDNIAFSDALKNCQADFMNVKEQLMLFKVEINDRRSEQPIVGQPSQIPRPYQ